MSNTPNKRIFPGLLLIAIGSIFLLDNLGIIPYQIKHYLFSWEGWLIMIGSFLLITRPNRPMGLILIIIGAFFIIPEIFDIDYNVHLYWPLILIVVGVFFLLRQQRDRVPEIAEGESSMDVLEDTSVFGGGDVVVTSENFHGGKVTYIFGGSSINLMRSKLAQGKAVIDVFAMFGGCTFIVPSDWNVRVEVTPIFGGFSDSRKPTAGTVIDEKKELVIKGTVLFGGGEVKSF